MKWWKLCLSVVMLVLVSEPGFASAIDGDWDGTLHTGAIDLRLSVHVETTNGATTGTLKSIDQGGRAFPISAFALAGSSVTFSVVQPSASFEGTLSSDGQSITGSWKQSGIELPLTFARRAAGAPEPGSSRPQEPHPPYPYRSEDVAYPGADGVTLAGTLTIPNGGGPFAAAILIAGSGPHDRDESIFGHKPFLVLADYLTRHGIAVLRSDKRGVGKSTGNVATATSEDFAGDVDAALAYLKTRAEIDPRKIGLIGHSEGGLIAPMVAAKDHSVAFIVLMAGPGLRGAEILYLQRHLIAEAMGEPADKAARNDDVQKKVMDAIVSARSPEEARANARAILAAANTGMPAANLDTVAATLASPWMMFFITYDPAPALKAVTCPVLAINGEKDLQVPPKEDLAAIKAALASNPDVTTMEFPGLNHLFQTAKTGAPTEYGQIDETIAPVVLDTIATWIGKHTT